MIMRVMVFGDYASRDHNLTPRIPDALSEPVEKFPNNVAKFCLHFTGSVLVLAAELHQFHQRHHEKCVRVYD